MARGQISLSDWILTVHHLKPADETERREMARALGLDSATPQQDPRLEGIWDQERAPNRARSTVSPSGAEVSTDDFEPTATLEPEQPISAAQSVPFELTPETRTPPSTPPPWLGSVETPWPLARPSPDQPEPAPLFLPRQTRNILGTAIATVVREGPPDLLRIVETVARRMPLLRLPRVEIPTLRRGVQLLLDDSEAMAPYREDQKTLHRRVERLVGRAQTDVGWFRGTPADGMILRGKPRGQPWTAPARGVPVLILSDLSIGAPLGSQDTGSTESWLQFAESARRNDSQIVVLVPFQPNRWPRAQSRVMHLVHWDRATRVGDVFRGLRRGRRG